MTYFKKCILSGVSVIIVLLILNPSYLVLLKEGYQDLKLVPNDQYSICDIYGSRELPGRNTDFNITFSDPSKYVGPIVEGWPPDASRSVKKYVPKREMSNIIHPRKLNTQNSHFLLIIHTRIKSLPTRNIIRQTWGSALLNLTENTFYYFFLGRSGDSNDDKKIREESLIWGDIIQEDFIESYNNLTLKSIFMLKFLTQTVKWSVQPKRIMKVDDDVFLNIPLLLERVFNPIYYCKEPYLAGQLMKVYKPHKSRGKKRFTGKWEVPEYMLYQKTYPPMLLGNAYFMSYKTAECLYEESFNLPYLALEDVFITCFVATRCNITRENFKGLFSYKILSNQFNFGKHVMVHYADDKYKTLLHQKSREYYEESAKKERDKRILKGSLST